MKIGFLTSSRADYGIYVPLLRELANDDYFDVNLIAFGTHLSKEHGETIQEIKANYYGRIIPVKTPVTDKDEQSIALAYAQTCEIFAQFWETEKFDLVICLGDRYEMSAAVQASIPYRIPLAHFHGGETTLGAIDNIYRHQITLAAKYHFTATEAFSKKVSELIGHSEGITTVGSLSLADLSKIETIDRATFLMKYNLPNKPFILGTFHPETVQADRNEFFAKEMIDALSQIPNSHHTIISLPNADTNGAIYRKALFNFAKLHPDHITLIESFGKVNYFSALKHAAFVIGNSSSGIIEAASFNKFVINIGDRQKGRLQSNNIINVKFESSAISTEINKLIAEPKTYSGKNEYTQNNTVSMIVKKLREIDNGNL